MVRYPWSPKRIAVAKGFPLPGRCRLLENRSRNDAASRDPDRRKDRRRRRRTGLDGLDFLEDLSRPDGRRGRIRSRGNGREEQKEGQGACKGWDSAEKSLERKAPPGFPAGAHAILFVRVISSDDCIFYRFYAIFHAPSLFLRTNPGGPPSRILSRQPNVAHTGPSGESGSKTGDRKISRSFFGSVFFSVGQTSRNHPGSHAPTFPAS